MFLQGWKIGLLGLAISIAAVIPGEARGAAFAETLEVDLEYEESALALTEREGFVEVRLPGCALLSRVGGPELPTFGELIVLPEGMRATGVQASSVSSIRFPCGRIRPAQPPAILGPLGMKLAPQEWVRSDAAIYEGTDLYPSELVTLRGTGRLGALAVAACEVHPVRYDPETGDVILHHEITLRLELEANPRAASANAGPRELNRVARRMAADRMRGLENLSRDTQEGRATDLDPNDYQYVIVTEAAQEGAYETYAEWKTAKGVPATVVTTEWIGTNYSGRDLAEKIRNFIIEAVDTWGTSYVLLAGDEHIVPSRVSWAFDCEAGFHPEENDIYADLYYSDLDGTWDENGNGVFGEVEDNVDLYPDVLVGRAPSDDLAEAQGIVSKFLTYERTPPTGYTMDAFFFAEILWTDPYTDSGVGKDRMGDEHFGAAYEPIERQYESLGNESVPSVWNALNEGPHLTNHGGHAWYDVLGCGTDYLNTGGVDLLANGPRYFCLYSIGCWSAAVDFDCIGEHFLASSGGGAIAYVGNSRYGWGSPGNPGWGYSETFDADFYGAILTEGLTEFGSAVAWAKILRIPFSQDENVYRVHEYQVNLLGDPEMACHTAEISTISLDAPATIPVGATAFTAAVTDGAGPVAGARVCLAGPDVYQMGFTDQAGQVKFSADPASAQTLTLTATAENHVYAQASVTASGSGPFLSVISRVIDDDDVPPSAGNGNGETGVGETVELFVAVHNFGGSAATGVTAILSESSPWVTIVQDTASYGTLTSGGEATNGTPFVFDVDGACPDDEAIGFSIVFEEDGRQTWAEALPLIVVAPGPRFHRYSAVDVGGDGDGIVDPGETVSLTVFVRNEGSGTVEPMAGTLTTSDPNLIVTGGSAATVDDLAPGATAALTPAFEVQVRGVCPETSYRSLDLELVHDQGTANAQFLLAVGIPGFGDDVEGGDGGWTHSGANDEWRRTDYRSHSGAYSWYCGTDLHQYPDNASASLVSPEFVAPEDGRLSFWCYFDVTTYGVDGMFVEVWTDGSWETLDYLGSGGALDSTLFICGWAQHACDLGGVSPGSTTRIRFRFQSDETEAAEGFYVDDVLIHSRATTAVDGIVLSEGGSQTFVLRAISANPTAAESKWELSLPGPARVTAHIYDARGRRVRSVLDGLLGEGEHEIRWDGRTDRGFAVPAGVYFMRVRAGTNEATRKIVKLGRS